MGEMLDLERALRTLTFVNGVVLLLIVFALIYMVAKFISARKKAKEPEVSRVELDLASRDKLVRKAFLLYHDIHAYEHVSKRRARQLAVERAIAYAHKHRECITSMDPDMLTQIVTHGLNARLGLEEAEEPLKLSVGE